MRLPLPPPLIVVPLVWLVVGVLIAEEPEIRLLSDTAGVEEIPGAEEIPGGQQRPEFPEVDLDRLGDHASDSSGLGMDLDDGLLEACDSFLFEDASSPRSSTWGTSGEIRGHAGGVDQGLEATRSLPGRFYDVLTEALCECDDCYQPEWRLLESASFWVDSARPQNRARLRWDYGPGMILPDRAEYFWARVGGRGPNPPAGSLTVAELDYHELSQYTETAHGGFSAFVVTPYRSLDMQDAGHAAGFGDVQVGTKSLLHDTPLLQITMQMTTTIPSANSRKGLGVGHVSLEPALLIGLALTDRDFLQAQAAEWIPIGGDSDFQGALLRWGVAWNRRLWQRDRDNVLTANLDLVGWSFQDGAFTDPVLGPQSANDETYLYLGPGTRLLTCGKFEFGVGGIFALTSRHFARSVLRSDVTMRY